MPSVRTARFAFAVVAALFASACGTTGSSGPLSDSQGAGDRGSAPKVTGNVQITLQLQPPGKPVVTIALVNETSEIGRRITSGKASSTSIRVIDDVAMATLIAAMDDQGFSERATPGVSFQNLRDYPGRRGVLVLDQSGSTRAIDFGTGLGDGPIPKTYVECKKLVMAVHGAVGGFEVRSTTSDEADRTFQAPKAQMPRR